MIKLITLLIIIINFILLYKKNHFISSTSIWLFCFLLIYVVYPIYSNGNFVNEGLIDKLSLIGIIAFSIGIFLGNRVKGKNSTKKENNPIPNFRLSRVFFFILFFASVFLAIRVYGLSNIRLLLKGDTTSRTLSLDSSGSIIVSFVQYAMIPCILSMWISSNNKKEKIYSIIALLLFLIESFVISFTRIFMISLLIMIFFHEMLKKNKKSQVTSSIIAILCIFALLVILNYIRCLGFSYNLSFKTLLNIDVIFESTDFSASYNMFNELLKHKSPFINPIVYLKPLFIFIPRTLWLTKPEYLNVQVLRYINPLAAESGLSSGISIMGRRICCFIIFWFYSILFYMGNYLFKNG